MMRAVVVDDELLAREELEALLAETGEFTVVGTCANAVQAIRTIKSTRPDVLFLDIQMPKVDGLKMLSMIDAGVMPCVVFVTAYDEYAINAFEKNAIDYLLKPVQPERLARAVDRLKRFLGEGQPPRYDSPAIERIPCMGAQSIKLIDTAEVEFVRSSETGRARGDRQGRVPHRAHPHRPGGQDPAPGALPQAVPGEHPARSTRSSARTPPPPCSRPAPASRSR